MIKIEYRKLLCKVFNCSKYKHYLLSADQAKPEPIFSSSFAGGPSRRPSHWSRQAVLGRRIPQTVQAAPRKPRPASILVRAVSGPSRQWAISLANTADRRANPVAGWSPPVASEPSEPSAKPQSELGGSTAREAGWQSLPQDHASGSWLLAWPDNHGELRSSDNGRTRC